jgi:phage virion morphogenesis protein
MSGVSVTVNDAQINAALSALRARVTDLKKPMTEVGGLLVTLTDLCFRDETSPWGDKWDSLKESTLARRRKGGEGARILRDTGRLAASFNYKASSSQVVVGTNVEYAATHQFGAEKGAFGKNKRGIMIPWGKIPARPFLPIRPDGRVDLPQDTFDDILDTFQRHIQGSLK